MTFGISAATAASIAAAAATVYGASRASSASNRATDAAVAASQENLALAREQRGQNQALYAPEIARGARADGYLDALLYGRGRVPTAAALAAASGGVGGSYGAPDWNRLLADRPDVAAEAQRLGMNPQQYAELWYNEVGPAAGDSYTFPAEAGGMAYSLDEGDEITRDDALAGYRASEPYVLGEQQYSDTAAAIDEGYGLDLSTLMAQRTALEGRASADFAARGGYTDAAIAGRTEQNNIDRQRLLDRTAAGFGVTGQLGKVNRAYTDESDYLNSQYADTVRRYRNEDYDPYADDMRSATAGYYAGALQAGDNRTNRRLTNVGQRYGNRQAAYGTYVGALQGDSARGQTGRNAIAGFNGAYTNSATAANNNVAAAYGQGAQNQSNIWGGAATSIAQIAGDAYGNYRYGRKTQQPKTG